MLKTSLEPHEGGSTVSTRQRWALQMVRHEQGLTCPVMPFLPFSELLFQMGACVDMHVRFIPCAIRLLLEAMQFYLLVVLETALRIAVYPHHNRRLCVTLSDVLGAAIL